MAARLITTSGRVLMDRKQRVVAYMPGMQAMVKHFRAFSTYDEQPSSSQTPPLESNVIDAGGPSPDLLLGPLVPQDRRFPMPGMVGPDLRARAVAPEELKDPDILSVQLPGERHASMLQQYLAIPREESVQEMNEGATLYTPAQSSPLENLECQAVDCPQILRKDFQDLFPDRDLTNGPLTIITISQKTTNDMSGWSPDIEEEREALLEHFVSSAQEVCESLFEAGCWADFIDPSSGRPFLSQYTNATMFETDERYRNFGFEIEDLGCCRVVRHHLWGTHAYVGCLFTTASVDHPAIQSMVKKSE